jgi:hypothetical protein
VPPGAGRNGLTPSPLVHSPHTGGAAAGRQGEGRRGGGGHGAAGGGVVVVGPTPHIVCSPPLPLRGVVLIPQSAVALGWYCTGIAPPHFWGWCGTPPDVSGWFAC